MGTNHPSPLFLPPFSQLLIPQKGPPGLLPLSFSRRGSSEVHRTQRSAPGTAAAECFGDRELENHSPDPFPCSRRVGRRSPGPSPPIYQLFAPCQRYFAAPGSAAVSAAVSATGEPGPLRWAEGLWHPPVPGRAAPNTAGLGPPAHSLTFPLPSLGHPAAVWPPTGVPVPRGSFYRQPHPRPATGTGGAAAAFAHSRNRQPPPRPTPSTGKPVPSSPRAVPTGAAQPRPRSGPGGLGAAPGPPRPLRSPGNSPLSRY